MSSTARRTFNAPDVTIAIAVALLAQLFFLAAFSMPSPELVEVDISNANAQPIAVSITPVLKLGAKTPTTVPSPWERRKPPMAKSGTPLPSTLADKNAETAPSRHVLDASAPPVAIDHEETGPNLATTADAGGPATATSVQGSEQGAANGTETDELKGRAADMYRAQLNAWFTSHFNIRGKLPFDRLRSLHARVTVSITPDRKVGAFTVDRPSGDPTFDAEVNATLAQIQSSGVELPAPPPLYPDILRSTLPVGFECTVREFCE